MRTPADLIHELEAEATHCVRVALVVGYESTTLFIWSEEGEKLRKLNEMIEQGGEPIGLLAYHSEGSGWLTLASRPLKEYENETWAQQYLECLTGTLGDLIRASGKPPS